MVEDERILIDVRTREEFVMGHIEGAINIPLYDMEYWKDFLSQRAVTVYCNTGRRTQIALRKLQGMGITVDRLSEEEVESADWTEKPMVCAVNYIEIRPGKEESFRKKAIQLCKSVEEFDGFLGSKIMRISGLSAIGSHMPGDLSDVHIEPAKYILLTFWESKEAHEKSHIIPQFKEIYDNLPEDLAKAPFEEFYEVLK